MSTPMFKVLAQSLRLGQPPDATSAIRVLVEVAEKQQAEIEDLRAKLTIATSRLQYAEARLARLAESAEGDGGRDPGGAERHAPDRPPTSTRSDAPRAQPSWPPPSAPQPPAAPTFAVPGVPRTPSVSIPLASAPLVESGLDDFNQTLVIDKRDVQQVAGAEAPFPLAPPRRPAEPEPARRLVEPEAPLPDLASEELSFEGDVTVTEQVTRTMKRPRPGSERE